MDGRLPWHIEFHWTLFLEDVGRKITDFSIPEKETRGIDLIGCWVDRECYLGDKNMSAWRESNRGHPL